MQLKLIAIIAVLTFNQLGCATAGVDPATQPAVAERAAKAAPTTRNALAPHGEVKVERTAYVFNRRGQTKAVTQRSSVLTGEKTAAPVDELLKEVPADPIHRPRHAAGTRAASGRKYDVDSRRYETVHHRKLTDQTKVVGNACQQPGLKRSPVTQPATPAPTTRPAVPHPQTQPAKG